MAALRRTLDWRFALTLLVMLGVGWAIYGLWERTEQSRETDAASLAQRTMLAERLDQVETALHKVNRRCQRADDCTPLDVDELPVGRTGADGAPGDQGAPGRDGRPGRDGQDGTDGTDGTDGQPGPQGLTGPQGDAGSSGTDGQPGPPGPAGADGQPGADGRGITDAQCDPDTDRWVVTWTTGETTDAGTCRTSGLPLLD